MQNEINNSLTKPTTETLPASLAERMARLRAESSTIEDWQPEAGETLVGIFIGWRKASGVYGENHQILIQDEHGHVSTAWLTNWLKENLRAQDAAKGDLIALTFLGKRLSPAGRTYNAYSLVVEKA